MTHVRTTEREVCGWMAGELNKILSAGGYSFAEASAESALPGAKSSLFPDLVIWFDRKAGQAFSFIEVKRPGGKENLDTLFEKAHRLRVRCCIKWDFREAVVYDCAKNAPIDIKRFPTYVLENLEQWKDKQVQVEITECLKQFLGAFNHLHRQGHLNQFVPDKLFFIKRLRHSVNILEPHFLQQLKGKIRNRGFKREIEGWASKQGIARVGDKQFYEILSRHLAYSLITRIIFYLAVRTRFPKQLAELIIRPRSSQKIDSLLHEAFEKAKQIDWLAVFEDKITSRLGIPETSKTELASLLRDLDQYDFGLLPEDVIGQVFEQLIPHEERHSLGQYFTPEDLVDFIIGFVAQTDGGKYGDPTCGSGTFLNRLYSRMRWLSTYEKKHHQILSDLWGIDVGNFPAELATINLFRQSIRDYNNFPRVLVSDFFEIEPGAVFQFPPPKARAGGFKKIDETMPQFDGLVGNFPYIRQELIEQKVKGYKKFLTKTLARGWFLDFPDAFATKRLKQTEIEDTRRERPEKAIAHIERWVDEGRIDLKLSGQADIYTYLFFHAARFVEPGGRLGFVTSNSWLDVAYGEHLKRFFLAKFKIVAIVGSWAEPWFPDASVNTVFVVLERCEDDKERSQHKVKFVKLRKRLEELIPQRDLKTYEAERWRHVDSLITRIEVAEHRGREKSVRFAKIGNLTTVEDDDFRIRVVPQCDLLKDLKKDGPMAKWGKYLRAPDVYFEIIDKVGDKLVPLCEVAEVKFGIKTGINDFFYLEPVAGITSKHEMVKARNARNWEGEIEAEFLKPVIKSPRESKSIQVDPDKLRWRLFMCDRSKAQLKRAGKLGALKYIEWGEQQRTKLNVSWPTVPSVQGRDHWWNLREAAAADALWFKAFNDRFVAFENTARVFSSDRMYEIVLNADNRPHVDMMAAMLNSSLVHLFLEINARVNLGDGALDNMVYEAARGLVVNPKSVTRNSELLTQTLLGLNKRPVLSIFEEVKKKDRQALDKAVLKALGLDPKQFLPRLYAGLTELVRERLKIPKMRNKQKQTAVGRNVQQIKDQVAQEILPEGLRGFPESFVPNKSPKAPEELNTTGKRLNISGPFFDTYEVLDEDGHVIYGRTDGRKALDKYQALFLVYSYKPGLFVLRLPKDPAVVRKAVRDYERHIRETWEALVTRAFEATFDHQTANRIANEILGEYGVTYPIP